MCHSFTGVPFLGRLSGVFGSDFWHRNGTSHTTQFLTVASQMCSLTTLPNCFVSWLPVAHPSSSLRNGQDIAFLLVETELSGLSLVQFVGIETSEASPDLPSVYLTLCSVGGEGSGGLRGSCACFSKEQVTEVHDYSPGWCRGILVS